MIIRLLVFSSTKIAKSCVIFESAAEDDEYTVPTENL